MYFGGLLINIVDGWMVAMVLIFRYTVLPYDKASQKYTNKKPQILVTECIWSSHFEMEAWSFYLFYLYHELLPPLVNNKPEPAYWKQALKQTLFSKQLNRAQFPQTSKQQCFSSVTHHWFSFVMHNLAIRYFWKVLFHPKYSKNIPAHKKK